jgi:hypothetical protein
MGAPSKPMENVGRFAPTAQRQGVDPTGRQAERNRETEAHNGELTQPRSRHGLFIAWSTLTRGRSRKPPIAVAARPRRI